MTTPLPYICYCSVPHCTQAMRRAHPGVVTCFSLPVRNPELCKQWIRAINSPKLTDSTPVEALQKAKVCTRHFKPEEIERNSFRPRITGSKRRQRAQLSPTAVPSLYLDKAQTSPAELAQRSPAQRTRTQVGNSYQVSVIVNDSYTLGILYFACMANLYLA